MKLPLHLKFLFAAVILIMTACFPTDARADEVPDLPLTLKKAYRGWYKMVDEYGDTVRMIVINDVPIFGSLKFKNKKEQEQYDKIVKAVRKTLPYAQAAGKALLETYQYIQTLPDPKERERHLSRMEKDIVARYKPAIMKLTKFQGKVLLKLINRETAQSSYNIVKAFLGTFRASFWQTFGSVFGINMKAGFDPDHNHEDFLIERAASLIEIGVL